MKFRDGFKLTSKANRRLPTEYFVLADVAFEGAVIGYLAGRPIREAVSDRDGLRYRFVGVAPRLPGGGFDVLALRSGEWIVLPGLVYAADASGVLVLRLLRTRETPEETMTAEEVKTVIAEAETALAGRGRLVIRKSGTEPKIRVMAEGDDAGQVEKVVDEICAAVEAAA